MRRVKDDRIPIASHDRQRPHVANQRIVSETGASLRHQDALIAGVRNFGDNLRHIPWRQKLPFFDVDGDRSAHLQGEGLSDDTETLESAERQPLRRRVHIVPVRGRQSAPDIPSPRGFRQRSVWIRLCRGRAGFCSMSVRFIE